MKNKEILTYAGYGVGIFLVYKLVNGLLVSAGLKKSDIEAKKEADATAARKKELDQATKTSALTRPSSEYYSAADTIYNALKFSSIDDDADKAQYAFTSIINSAADLAFLKVVYGVRPTYNFGLKQGDFDLITTLQREFSTSRYAETIAILKAKGVNL